MRRILVAMMILAAAPASAQDAADRHRYWEMSPEDEERLREREVREGRACATDGCYVEAIALGALIVFGLAGR